MPKTPLYQRFFADLKRRKVFRVMGVYGAIAFGLIQVVDIVLPRLGLPDWTVTFVVWLCVLGFPAAVVLAWAYERTPEGLRLTDEAGAEELDSIVAESAGKRWSSGMLALLGIVAMVTGAWWAGRSTAMGTADGPSPTGDAGSVLLRAYIDLSEDLRPAIAVLPFTDLSQAGDQRYFADGMSEELLNALAKVRGLRVAGRTSSFAFRNAEKDLREIGSELGVRYLVEGSLRKQGDRLRITAQLVDAGDNFHIWSETYDRTLDDVFAVQEELARAISDQLQVSLGLEGGGVLVAPTADIQAYDLYLRAKALIRERGAGVLEAVTLLKEVVARDSMWAPGWAVLGQAHSLVPYYEPGGSVVRIAADSWESALDLAEAAAKRALALDPRVATANVALGNAYRDRWNWDRAEGHYVRALEIDPDDVEAHQQYSELLAGTGRMDEALRSARRAAALDPTSAIRLNGLGWALHLNARNAEAVHYFELAIQHSPELAMTHHSLSVIKLALGDVTEAERLWREEYVPRLGLDEATRAAWDRGASARYEAIRNRDAVAYARCCTSFNEPADWLVVGDTARAIQAIRDRYRQRPRYNVNALFLLWQPELDGIREDPQFQEAVSGVLDDAGLTGVVLRRAPLEG
jgi:TolB-like protein/Tfp pilus assembly protein PilF